MSVIDGNQKAVHSKQKIYKGLRRLLLTKQLKDITVSDIQAECGISRSTFYRNFNNIVDVLAVMLEFFYNRYLERRVGKSDQLAYFFEYWQYHRDLINIISNQCPNVLTECVKKYEKNMKEQYYLDLKVAIITTILSKWSSSHRESPEEMVRITKGILNTKCIDIIIS